NTIITSLKALDEGYSSKNYVRKFLRALHPKWRAKVTVDPNPRSILYLNHFLEIHSDESKVHIKVLSVLWGNRLPIPDGSLPLSRSSRKRRRSPDAATSLPITTSGALVPAHVDLLPPRKRFRDSLSPKDSMEKDMETGIAADIETRVDTVVGMESVGIGRSEEIVKEDEDGEGEMKLEAIARPDIYLTVQAVIEECIAFADTIRARGTDVRLVIEVAIDDQEEIEICVDPQSIPVVAEDIAKPEGEGSPVPDCILKTFEDMPIDLDNVVHDFYRHMSEVRPDRITEIEYEQRQLAESHVIADRERVRMLERIGYLEIESMKLRGMLCVERERIDSLHHHMALS
ncbi:hypothetical protein Tco_1049358, partial [Tanacetum coccineum]